MLGSSYNDGNITHDSLYFFKLYMSRYTSAAHTRLVECAVLLAIALGISVPLLTAHADTFPQRVSVASDGTEGNSDSLDGVISSDDRYVAYDSSASNLVPDDTNGTSDVFIHDTLTGSTTRVSVASDGTQGNAGDLGSSGWLPGSWAPQLSANGRYVTFFSSASNLVPGGTDGLIHLFVHDMLTGSTILLNTAGVDFPNYETLSGISADGRYVAFEGNSLDDGVPDVYVNDTQTGSTTRVSAASDGTPGNAFSYVESISPNGRYVAFYSTASNLVSGDTNGAQDVFVHDMVTGSTTRVSVASDGTEGNGDFYCCFCNQPLCRILLKRFKFRCRRYQRRGGCLRPRYGDGFDDARKCCV